jgi:small subunit ribosomal protein S4
MARYTGPVCKLCRREGEKLFLKGSRCLSPKCAIEKRAYPPGQHGKDASFKRGRSSNYATQLREKQKVRRIYGVLERQFRRYYAEASRRPGLTGTNLLVTLETRMDNVVYRMGFAESRSHARQLVQHGHFMVNGVNTDIPSYSMHAGDIIAVREGSMKRPYFKEVRDFMNTRTSPDWMKVDVDGLSGTVGRLPERHEIDIPINEQLIVEYYSR